VRLLCQVEALHGVGYHAGAGGAFGDAYPRRNPEIDSFALTTRVARNGCVVRLPVEKLAGEAAVQLDQQTADQREPQTPNGELIKVVVASAASVPKKALSTKAGATIPIPPSAVNAPVTVRTAFIEASFAPPAMRRDRRSCAIPS
jgi:hypothetical protein